MIAGRDGVRVARLAVAHGRAGMLFVAIVLASIGFAALAGWLAQELAESLTGPAAQLFVAIALAIAGFEVLLLRAGPPPAEPTHSLGATLLVLLAALVTGAAGFLVLAMAVMTGEPVLAGAGGAMGAMAALSTTALVGSDWDTLPHGRLRVAGASCLLLAGGVTGFLAISA